MVERCIGILLDALPHLSQQYHRLAVVAAPPHEATVILEGVSTHLAAPLLNVSLEVSHRLLEYSERQRPLRIQGILDDLLRNLDTPLVLLDHSELLFEPSLQQRPLALLQGLARHWTIIAAWNGSLDGETLIYAEPGHREHSRHPTQDVLVITP